MSAAKKRPAPKSAAFPAVLYGTRNPEEGDFVLTAETLDEIDAEDGAAVAVYALQAVKRLRVKAPILE